MGREIERVQIPKKQRGKFRPLGIPCLRDRVAQTAATLVLSPIFDGARSNRLETDAERWPGRNSPW